jgi:hypothetical protein
MALHNELDSRKRFATTWVVMGGSMSTLLLRTTTEKKLSTGQI